ncbi:uncharacterized protein [Triticum aestivum]|uniref:uncharacterized protein isoform X4 n=1 Tax=Triticum aestivum TaxID=4565 RepID=UPI001D00582A|nr:uncharacterized protein LOC123078340 isoform X4 [Triticum aestivum]
MELAAAPSNDALRPGMARALDGRNGRIKEAARDGGSRALHAVASHGRMPVCVYLLEKHVQRKCQRTFGHSFFLFSQQTGLYRAKLRQQNQMLPLQCAQIILWLKRQA